LVALLALPEAWLDQVTMRGTSRISVMSGSARLCHGKAAESLRLTTPSALHPSTSHVCGRVGRRPLAGAGMVGGDARVVLLT
jgi:hypothetical protein